MPPTPANGTERAARLLTNPVRTWAVKHALRTGQVTGQDIALEWPMYTYSHIYMALHHLTAAGWLHLDPAQPKHPPYGQYTRYLPGDLTGLHELHAEVTALLALSPTPEVPREAHD